MAVKNDEMTFNDIDWLASKHDERGYDLDDVLGYDLDDEWDDKWDDERVDEWDYGTSLTIKDLQKCLENIGKYRSFTTLDENNEHKVYNLIDDEKVTGLLRDVRTLAKTTAKLSPEERRQKPLTMEAFAAYVMYYCAKKVSFRDKDQDPDKVLDVMNKPLAGASLYQNMLNWVKKEFVTGKLKSFRSIVTTAADQRNNDIYRWETAAKRCPKGGKKSYVPMTTEYEDGTEAESPEYAEYILVETAAALRSLEDKETIEVALGNCSRKGLLTNEQLEIICCAYGLGDGYEEMMKKDIAAKLGKSNSYISQQLKSSYKILHKYITENKLIKLQTAGRQE